MGDVATLVSGIDYKIRKLIERHSLLIAENERHIKEIQELKKINENQKNNIRQLEEKINLIKLAKALENKEGNVEAKLKINDLVREIEKCIGLIKT